MKWDEKYINQLTEWVENNYYDGNFGRIPKSEVETLLFSIYLDRLIDSGEKFDDYTVGRDLGLTISRVRNLKERKQWKYSRKDYRWSEIFANCIKNAKYDDVTKLIKVNIPDVNVIKDLRYFMEQNGWYDEYQLNPKLFQCPLDTFVMLCNNLPNEDGSENVVLDLEANLKGKLRELEDQFTDEKDKNTVKEFINNSTKNGLKTFIKSASKEVIRAGLSAIPFGGVAATAISFVVKVIENS